MDAVDITLRVAPLLLGLGSLAWTIGIYRSSVRKKELDELGQRIDRCEARMASEGEAGNASRQKVAERLITLENQLNHMPDKDTVHRLELAVADIKGDVKAQGEAVKGLADNLRGVAASGERIESYMLQGAKK